MKIAVIGKNGQLAKALKKTREIQSFSKEEIDLADPEPLMDCHFDVLINAGAYNATERAELEPELAFTINAHGVGKLAKIAKAKNALFVHVGSDFVFSGQKGDYYTESDPVGPLNIYGTSKALGEKLAQLCPRHYVFRTASLYSDQESNFPSAILRRVKEGKEVRVIDDMIMSPTRASCLAEWIYKAIDLKIPYGLYHAVNKGKASWYQFAVSILAKENLKVDIQPCSHVEYPSAIKRPLYSPLAVDKLEKEIGPMLGWEEALYV